MMDPTNLPRLYGEKEIGQILQRAAELQHEEPPAPSADSMTLQELEDIAAEAGIDPAYLRRAALEVDIGTAERSTWAKFVGEELLLVKEITVPGELREDGFECIVGVIERGTSEHGQSSMLGRTLTWRGETSSKYAKLQLTVASRDGQTSVRLEENLTKSAGEIFGISIPFFGAVGTVFGVGLAGVTHWAVGPLVPLAAMSLAYFGARAVYRAIVKKRRRVLGDLMGPVLSEAEACVITTIPEDDAADEFPENRDSPK